MSARTEAFGAGSPAVRFWYGAIVVVLVVIAAIVVALPPKEAEPVARPNAAVRSSVGELSPGASAAERIAVRGPFRPTHGAGDFRGAVKRASDGPTAWSNIASDPRMVRVHCGSCR